MELHAASVAGAMTARGFADEVRAELARQRRTAVDLAAVLGTTQHTVGRRLNGSKPFNAIEMVLTARYLGVSLAVLWERAAATAPEAAAP